MLAFAADTDDTGPIVERVTGPTQEEVEAYDQTVLRFKAGVEEFERDTLAFVDSVQTEERTRLLAGYDSLLDTLGDQEGRQRSLAMDQLQYFLSNYGDSEYASDVRLRLAELYFTRIEQDWLNATDRYDEEYDRLEAADDILALEELGDPPVKDLAPVIDLLDAIITRNRGLSPEDQYELVDVAYYMLGFVYTGETHLQYEPSRAMDVFLELIEAYPTSDYADQAHLIVGNFYFDENRYEEAIAEFRSVVDRGEESKQYSKALYQLAWAYYKRNRYDEAMQLFVNLLDSSHDQLQRTGRRSSFEPDAVRYLAHSLADLSDEWEEGMHPVDVGTNYFSSLAPDTVGAGGSRIYGSGRDWERQVWVDLADVLTQYGRTDGSVDVYKYLQTDPRWSNHPENINYQMEVVTLLSVGLYADPVRAGAEQLWLTNTYGETSDWVRANQDNPEALATARAYIEDSLLNVAIEFHMQAQETGVAEDYLLASARYREYLDSFPISRDYYQNLWFYADTLNKGGEIQAAHDQYMDLVKTSDHHKFGDGAFYFRMNTAYQLMTEQVGQPGVLAEGAPIERTYTTPAGKEITVYGLLDPQTEFIEAADAALSREFAEPDDETQQDYGAELDQKRTALMYIPGQVQYYANRYDEARPRLLDLIERFPHTEDAGRAAALIVNSYINEGNLAEVRAYSLRFRGMTFGEPEFAKQRQRDFADVLERTAFEMASSLKADGKFAAAAAAFLSFADEFPESPYVPDALINAGYNYERVGQTVQANEIFEDFVNRYADHPESENLYFRIADNYGASFQLDKAIDYYERLVRYFPNNADVPAASYNIAFLRVGAGDHKGAAMGYEAYANSNPNAPDREAVLWAAGEQWELVSDRDALKFYKRYLKTMGTAVADHAIQAQYKMAGIYERAKNRRETERAYKKTLDMFDTAAADASQTLSMATRDMAASIAFPVLQERHDEIVAFQMNDKNRVDFINVTTEDIRAFQGDVMGFVNRFASFEYVTAAWFIYGETLRWYAETGLDIEPPDGLSDIQMDAYWELLEEKVFPKFEGHEQEAVDQFEAVLRLAKDKKRHSEWVTRSALSLNEIRPEEYPAEKPESIVPPDGTAPQAFEPKTIVEVPEEEEAAHSDSELPVDPNLVPPEGVE